MPKLVHVIYNSGATVEFTDSDLTHLLTTSRNKNAAADITGMLLFVNGTFFQVLEGPEDVIDDLMRVIQADSRHHRVVIIIREPIAKRAFG